MKSSKIKFYITKFAEKYFAEDINGITTKYMNIYVKSNQKIEGKETVVEAGQ